jgi:peptide/nickel transport system substrate-binding protein
VIRRRRRRASFAALLVVGAFFAQPSSSASEQSSRIFRVSLAPQSGLDHIDPALSFTAPGWALLDTTCARLMTYPDKRPPKAFELVPEVAAGPPRVSSDFKRYTFTLKTGFRFSDGSRVRASAFAHAINRTLAPDVRSPGALFTRDIVGAADVLAGRRKTARGVDARGNTLVVRFVRAAPDFPARTALPFFCAVQPGLPAVAEGVRALHAAGPFRVVEYRPGERVVIRQNRFYGGTRPRRVDGFDVDLRAPSPTEMIRRIDRGEADWGHTVAGVFMDPSLGLRAKYGINKTRFFMKPGFTLRLLAFNSSRRLFKNNPRLRRAVNFALDRTALLPTAGGSVAGRATDQHLPFATPGFRDAALYPLDRADPERARALAEGNLRGGKAVLYTSDFPLGVAASQAAARQLHAIGLNVEVQKFPIHIATAAYLGKLATPREPWDIALVLWTPNIPDAFAYLNLLLEARFIGGTTLTGFQSREFERQLRRAARLKGRERRRAYADLDIRLAREAAPVAALNVINEATLVSDRVRCITLRPVLDLATVCLEE